VKHTVWQIRADSIRKLNRVEKEPEAIVSGSDTNVSHNVVEGAASVPF